jgi:hypothetical protein
MHTIITLHKSGSNGVMPTNILEVEDCRQIKQMIPRIDTFKGTNRMNKNSQLFCG